MSKLFKLKEWLTIAETARHLSIVFGEEVTEADVLRLALDGHLKLSVHLVNGAYARPCVSRESNEIEWEEIPSLDGSRTVQMVKGGRIWQDERGLFQVLPCITELDNAVWDLPMTGGERIDVEYRYQQLTGGPEVTSVTLDGVLVASTNGNLFEIQSHYEDNPYFDKKKHKLKAPSTHIDNFHPAGALPDDCVFVVRTKALTEFEKTLSEEQDKPLVEKKDKPLSTTERSSLLKLVIGMAIRGYGYDPKAKKNKATNEIAVDLEHLEIHLSDDTIRSYLREAAETVLPASPDKS